jgi:ADP-ribose pyrophosphatase YjhB (NUDIX family)
MKKAALAAFARLPAPVRRLAVHAGTPSFTVGAVIVLRRTDRRILFVEQRHTRSWALPGGLLRRHESPVDGVVREVQEEVGVHLDPQRLPVPLAAVNARARRVDLVFVVDDDLAQRPRAADDAEVTRVGWFGLDDLPDVAEPTRDILATIRLA